MVMRAGNSARVNFNFQVQYKTHSKTHQVFSFNASSKEADYTKKVETHILAVYLLCWQASPIPTIKWLKDGLPVAKHVTVSNSDTSSQLIIPSSERQDTGIYTIIVKNLVGQETSSVEIRITGTLKTSVNPKI